MYYRRKIILALLQHFDGQLDKIRLQKLLFLFAKKQTKAAYDFIPYKFGCYSYSANADLMAMGRKGIVVETRNHFKRKDGTDYLNQLNPADQKLLHEVKIQYGSMSPAALMKYTYIHFPFYATRSEAAHKILSSYEYKKITEAIKTDYSEVLFTIGYEGISLEEFLGRLLRNDIKVLVDREFYYARHQILPIRILPE